MADRLAGKLLCSRYLSQQKHGGGRGGGDGVNATFLVIIIRVVTDLHRPISLRDLQTGRILLWLTRLKSVKVTAYGKQGRWLRSVQKSCKRFLM
jgi:hypothetical protein